MSNDSSSDLDARIAAIVESSVGRMRDELLHRMQDTESRLRDITGRMGGESPAPEAPAIAAEPPVGTVPDLFEAVLAMDHGGSQQEVLAALLEGIGRFAGRAALFLTRADGARGWGSYGFEETAGEIQDVVLSYSEGPLATLAEGKGCVPLAADDCAALCDQMAVAPGAEGMLLPFVLRDRLAAALYVDRSAEDAPLPRQPLQLLAYVGAQAVEGLAMRKRGETPTLLIAGEAVAAPGVELWEAPAPAEPEVAVPAEPEPEPAAPEESAPSLSEPQYSPPPEVIAAAPPATVEPPAEMAVEEVPAELAIEPPPALEPEPEPVAEAEWTAPLQEPEVELPPVEPEEEPPQPMETAAEPEPAPPAEEPAAWTESTGAGFATVEMESISQPEPAEIPPAAADAGESTEVRPPTDVSGPGWAFTASRTAAESGDEAQHEEARRLARLLVTEIKLYNEEQVEEGRRGNDIYARLREDIDRSRQIFNERVDEAVRQEADYFHEEMVRILAGGNAEALGL